MDRDTGVDLDVDREVEPRAHSLAGIGKRIVAPHAVGACGGQPRRGVVTLADDGGEQVFVDTFVVVEQFDGAQPHAHVFARHQIGHGLDEDIRPLLLEKRGLAPFVASRIVNPARLFTPANLTADDAQARAQFELVDRRLVAQRKRVDRFDRMGERVGKGLLDHRACDEPRDLDAHLGALQRHLARAAVVEPHDQATRLARRLVRSRDAGFDSRDREQEE